MIQQPPPTPGIVDWVLGSLFSKQTPSHKYSHQYENKPEPQQQQQQSYRTQAKRRESSYLNDEAVRLRNYYKERELLYDEDNNDTFHRRSNSMGHLASNQRNKVRLDHPGKFPSPYHRNNTADIPSSPPILSSTSKNFKLANKNAQRNKNIIIDSSPIVIPNKSRIYSQNLSKYDDQDELQILKLMESNNDDLKKLTRNVERLNLAKSNTNDQEDYNKLQQKYTQVKSELITELKKSQKLYDSYYRFVEKYKKLKNERNFNGNSDQSIRILEDKLLQQQQLQRDERISFSEKIESLDTKLIKQQKDHELEIWRKDQKIRELERKLESNNKLSISSLNYEISPEKSNRKPLSEIDNTLELFNIKYPDK